MKKTLLPVLLALAAHASFAYSSLDELMADMNRKQVEAIRGYLEANPDAADVSEARERLIYGLVSLEDYDGALSLLEELYNQLPADKTGLDIESAFGEIVVPMIHLYKADDRMDQAKTMIARVREDFTGHEMAGTINEALDEFYRMFDVPGVGDAMELAFTAMDGREINLASMTGNVVLVDFWATWCMPCIRAMPDIKALFGKYHEKGLEIIGVSLDEDREALEDYLAREKIAWPQHFDGLGWQNKFAAQYGIQAIPATFLIGPDGKITAVNPGKEELDSLVDSLLNGPVEDVEDGADK